MAFGRFKRKRATVSGSQVGGAAKIVYVCVNPACRLTVEKQDAGQPVQCQACGGLEWVRMHSKSEARRWAELRLLLAVGKIGNLELQHVYKLHAVGPDGVKRLVGKYIADFNYDDIEKNRHVCEDVKGADTVISKWKRRHAEIEYGITINLT